MINWHYLNNKWVKGKDLKISAFDLAVTRGFGIFEFLRTYQRQPFFLKDHLDRFFHSAKLFDLKIPKTKKEIAEIVFQGIKKNPAVDLNIKIILTGGETVDGITPIGKHLFIVTFSPVVNYPEEFYQKGIKVITLKSDRFLPEAKSLNYTQAVLAMIKAKKMGAEEALYIDKKGRITEATRSNFFAILDKKLVTPNSKILSGITRKIIFELAKKLKIPLVKRLLFTSEIKNFEEAFITATNKEIMPVVKIDNIIINKGRVGEMTKRLMKEFKVFVSSQIRKEKSLLV